MVNHYHPSPVAPCGETGAAQPVMSRRPGHWLRAGQRARRIQSAASCVATGAALDSEGAMSSW